METSLQRYYVSTGKNRVTVDATSVEDAAKQAVERIVSDESRSRAMGRLLSISKLGFDIEYDDYTFVSTTTVMKSIGFKEDENGYLFRCPKCRGIGLIDCCSKTACLDCGGSSKKLCPDC